MRLRNITDARKTLEKHTETVILDPTQHKGQWKRQFGNDNPLFLEIGMGKGQFICGMSDLLPDVNFLGLEKYDSVLLRAMQKSIEVPRQNVFLLRGNAEYLSDYFADNEIDRIYLNFSDPWPRKSNKKRRLTHSDFLDKYKKILIDNGEIHLKTDNRNFFEFTLQHMNEYGMKFDHISLDLHSEEPDCNVRSEYEVSRSAAGFLIYQLICRF
ncbi:MAG: tRNA (guanosine(46)-N7)-methyltransferase TrmB [Holophagales bacterium]|jgi:tRNA (guanine-N7-)-methyltransferase|nr:tRNA (guanosine(46)-N7)-methyltransferase TrmB [Holophagales bacterium]